MHIDLTADTGLYRGVSQCLPEPDGVLELSRMSARLKALYSTNDPVKIRASCATGVRLAFETDSPWLRMS